MAELQKWATDKNYHVRRLVSEGTRPRLPWSGRLSLDAAAPLPPGSRSPARPRPGSKRCEICVLRPIAVGEWDNGLWPPFRRPSQEARDGD